jgi:3',5'-cyclic AMP phosphodiesterase CpdA
MLIAHLSDLHFGKHDERLAGGLGADIRTASPDLIVVSGDFTQVGNSEEFAAARAFLDTLSAPVLAVPGNHDVPACNLFRRFLNPYGLYRRYIAPETEPFVVMDGVAVAGIKTSRRMRIGFNWSDGSINRAQLANLEARFATAPDAVKIVVAHHPLLEPEAVPGERVPNQNRAKRADLALETFARLGVRLVLSGHFHLSYVRKHEHRGEVKKGQPTGPREAAAAPILVAQASSTISTRLRGNLNAYNLVAIENGVITIRVREWAGESWVTREKAVATA